MSHRKVYSQGSIPFSWEQRPGISKVAHKENPLDSDLQSLDLTCVSLSSSSSSFSSTSSQALSLQSPHEELVTKSRTKSIGNVSEGFDKAKLPLPPCRLKQYPLRSSSTKGNCNTIRLQEDPFLMAYKECTKSSVDRDDLGSEGHKSNRPIIGFKVIKKSNKSMFSCKNSCDVKEMPKLPTLSKDKVKRLIR